MKVIQGKVIGSVKIRQSPAGAEFVPGRYLTAGMTIEASENSNQWLHLTKINDVPVTDTEWASAGSTQQYIQWQWVDVPDPTPVPAAPYKCHFEGTVTLTDPNGVVYSAPVSFDLDLNKNA